MNGMNETNTVTGISEVLKLLQGADDYLILCHAHPDGDAIGSAEALRLLLTFLGKKAVCCCADAVPSYLRFLVQTPFLHTVDEIGTVPFRHLICVDTAQTHLLGNLAPFAEENGVFLKLDHHRTGDRYAANEYTDPTAAAAGEILFALAEAAGAFSSAEGPAIAGAVYGAIATDTGCFRFSNTTAKTFRTAAFLAESGLDTAQINTRLFDNRPLSTAKATALGISRMELLYGGKAAVLLFTKEMKESGGFTDEDISGLSGSMRGIEGVELALCLRQTTEDEQVFRLSSRSKEWFDCTKLCALFGGGGHLRAAGATLTAASPDEALNRLKTALDTCFQGNGQREEDDNGN